MLSIITTSSVVTLSKSKVKHKVNQIEQEWCCSGVKISDFW